MKQEIISFIQKVAEDKDLQEKMQACMTPEEGYAFASSIQAGFTFDEFVETMAKLKDITEDNGELSDEDLAAVAGGMTDSEQMLYSAAIASISFVTCYAATLAA